MSALRRRGVARRLAAGVDSALFDSLPAALLVDRDYVIRRVNPKAAAALVDAREGVAALSLFPAASRGAVEAVLAAAFAGGAALEGEGVSATVLGDAVLLHLTGPAQSEAVRRLQVLGQLAGGIAHDFNNLLTAITAAAEAVAQSPADAAVEAARIREAARRGGDLAQRLLAFGRQQVLRPRPAAVNEAVRATAEMLRPLMGPGITLVLTPEEPGRAVNVDPVQLDQVLVNLAVNARDAMPTGGVLTLATGHATLLRPLPAVPEPVPPGRWVTIEVRDSGSGIAPDVLPRIFDPFFTTRTAQAGTTGGTGLGLATVHGILRQSGGFLAVRTELGVGTSMTVYLPRWEGAVPAPEAAKPKPATGGEGRTVLLVEDEDLIRDAAVRALQRLGWRVLAAESAEEALEMLDGEGAALAAVVSDIVLPGMDGPSLVRAVRARAGAEALPAILMSGYAAENERRAVAALGGAFMAKPYAMQDLAARLAEVVCS